MEVEEKVRPSNALKMIFTRNAFYRDKYQLVLGVFFLTLIVLSVLVGIIVYLYRHPTEPIFFPADGLGRLIQEVPLQEANMATPDAMAWVVEAVQATMSHDFINFRGQMQNSQKYFTEVGWRDYLTGLKKSNNLIALTTRKFVVAAKVVGAPEIVKQGIIGGALGWRMKMHVLVTYMYPPFDDVSSFQNAETVEIILQRQKVLQSYKGLGIIEWIESLEASNANAPQALTNPVAQ